MNDNDRPDDVNRDPTRDSDGHRDDDPPTTRPPRRRSKRRRPGPDPLRHAMHRWRPPGPSLTLGEGSALAAYVAWVTVMVWWSGVAG